jgi:predicted transcriptional regulator of viral defense system
MSLEEYLDRRSKGDHFLDGILKSPYIPVIGDPRELVRVAQKRLARDYAARIGNSAAAKRLGFLMESFGLGDAEALRASAKPAAGYPRLDPTLPARGKYNRRWGLLINVKVGE